MRMIWIAVLIAVAVGAGVYGALHLRDERQAQLRVEAEARQMELVKWCMLRKEYWSRIQPALRTPEPECVALGIIEP